MELNTLTKSLEYDQKNQQKQHIAVLFRKKHIFLHGIESEDRRPWQPNSSQL